MSIPIRGVSHGSAGAAFETAKRRGAQRLDFLLEYLKALYADCATVGIRADILVAQADLETGAFTSRYWIEDGNPAGLAAFDDGSNWGLTFTPQKAARAHVVHMLCYLGIEPPDGWKAADARWDAAVKEGYFGSVDTAADLGNGRWATDPKYAEKIASRHAAYNFAPPVITTPQKPTEGKEMAYTPRIVDAWLTQPYAGYAGQVRYHNRNWAGVQAFAVHVQDGNSNGTQMHFRTVKASSTVLIDKDGTIRRLVPEDKAPWTNGDVKNPDATVRALMNKYGPDPNTWTLTIEAEGYSGGLPYTEAQYQSILWQLREWKKKYGDKPVLPHYKINSVTRSTCPEDPDDAVLMPRLLRDLEDDTPSADVPFKRGDTVEFTENLNVRRAWTTASTYQGKPNVLATKPKGTKATIIAGPNYADGYAWMDVSIDGFGTGHVAADWLKKVEAPAPTPIVKSKTFTTRFELLLRTTPGFWDKTNNKSNVIRSIPAGTTGIVKEGPKDADGVGFYRVELKGGETGWIQTEVLNTVEVHEAD